MKIVIYVLILGIFSVCPTLAMDVDEKENHRKKFKNIKVFSFDALRDSLPTLPKTKKAKKGPLKRLAKSGPKKAKSKKKRPVTPRHSSPIHSEDGGQDLPSPSSLSPIPSEDGGENPLPSPSLSPILPEDGD